MPPDKRAALYARVSYYDRKGDNLDAQLELCREYASGQSYAIVAELTEDDRGASGASWDLPALNKALDLARRDRIDVLVTRELDRFARGLAKQLLVERDFAALGVAVEYALAAYDDTPEGQLTKHVRAIIAEYEREKITERMTRGRIRAAREGSVMMASPPFGYAIVEDDDTRELVVLDDEAIWVRQIYKWYIFGDEPGARPLSFRAIANRLTEQRVPTASDRLYGGNGRRTHDAGKWYIGSVRRILTTSTYYGKWIYTTRSGDIAVPVPAIVTRDLFDRAQRRRRLNQSKRGLPPVHEYLLRGRVTCHGCGLKMESQTARYDRPNGHRYVYHYYRCAKRAPSHARQPCKPSTAARADQIDPIIWRELRALIASPERLAAAQALALEADASHTLDAQLERAERRLDVTRAKLDRLLDLYLEGQHTQAALQRRQRALEDEIRSIAAERDKLVDQAADAEARQRRAFGLRQVATEIGEALSEADDDFFIRRWIVEVLDVVAVLESTGEGKRAHVSVDGEQLFSVEIPQSR